MRRISCYLALALGAVASAAGHGPDLLAAKGAGACVPGPETLCLAGGRLAFEVDWEDAEMAARRGQVLPFASDDWGFFYFDDPRYIDLMVKVYDFCALNGTVLVFLDGLSDSRQTVTMTDTVGGTVQTYDNLAGAYFEVAEFLAFPCISPPSTVAPPRPAPPRGAASPPTMALADGRFLVGLEYSPFVGAIGFGVPVPVTSHAGYFWIFEADKPDVAVKIFDGGADNGFFWVVIGDTIGFELALHVTDVCTGLDRTFSNPAGSPGTVADEMAFAVDQACDIFSDGFETGDASAWSASVPPP